ncbi:hypothetical protein Mal52_24570 [Symmachiella dynata]|uniref:DUF5009 domain-containing protein n=1 Tax=Symmachiella dynata TaxID=2527995 RepID=A0A517ZND0_9PLAN|nr:DUF5009 domain-containing protein [Symmachiella dynata]QDU43979.1 hypothetical protein Mal52_24570 [Symmachiella dynata]
MTTTPAASLTPAPRLISLDAYRGFTMLAMASGGLGLAEVATHHPDSAVWQEIARQMEHLPWVGCVAWDLIQPSFMFMVGVSMAYSYASRQRRGDSYGQMFRHALFRGIILTLLGVFLRSNHKPETYWTFEDVVSQIGLGYVFLFLLWGRSAKVQFTVAMLVLIGYWALFAFWPLPGTDFDYASAGVDPDWEYNLSGFAAHWNKNTNAAHAFDVWFLNLFPRSTVFQNNGGGYHTLSFIPSLATMIFGLMAGELLRSPRGGGRKFLILVGTGALAMAVGYALDFYDICPIVKRIWTPSWTIYSSGICLLILAAFYGVIDLGGIQFWAWPAVVVGMNSIAIYIMTWLFKGWIRETYQTHLGQEIFNIFGEQYASLVEHMAILLAMWLICLWMYRRKIFLRI